MNVVFAPTLVTVTLTKSQVSLLRRLVKKRMEKVIQLEDPQREKDLDILDDIAIALARPTLQSRL